MELKWTAVFLKAVSNSNELLLCYPMMGIPAPIIS